MAKATRKKTRTEQETASMTAARAIGKTRAASVLSPVPTAWRDTILLDANKAAVEETLGKCGPDAGDILGRLLREARGDWRRKMIVKRIREIEDAMRDAPAVTASDTVPTAAVDPSTFVAGPPALAIDRSVPLAEIDSGADRDNHRMDTDDLESLMTSLSRDGLLQPVILGAGAGKAKGKKYRLVDGRRRFAAAKRLGWEEIRAMVYPDDLDEQTIRRLQAVVNLERRDLNPVEEALAVVRLLEAHTGRSADVWTDVDAGTVAWAAAALGRSEAWIRNRAYLTRLCPRVRAMVADGRLPLAQAREICKLASAEDQADIAQSATGFVEAGETSIHVDSVAQVRRNVGDRLSTLRGVPWEPGEPFAGRLACDGCPDNSACSLLFGVDAKDAAPEARCLNAVCYRVKMRVAEAAIDRVVTDLRVKMRVADEAIDSAVPGVPEYLKASTVARKLDQARGTAPKPKAASKGGSKKVPYQERPENKLAAAVHKWKGGVSRQVVSACLADPTRMARLALAPATKTWGRNVGWSDQASKAVRAKCYPILAKVAAKDAAKALGELAADIDPERTAIALPLWAVRHLAGLLDVNLPPEPKIEDFLPKEAASDKPQATSHGGKKGKGKKATPDRLGRLCVENCSECGVKGCEDREDEPIPE